MMPQIVIVGAGLVGALCAVFLSRRGCRVSVYEKRKDPRKQRLAGGRSINLVVSERGWRALAAAGADEAVRKITVSVYGRMTHDTEGKQSFIPYSADRRAIASVSRNELNCLLLDHAERTGKVSLHFGMRCTAIDPDLPAVTLMDERRRRVKKVKCRLLIGADGAFSEVREQLARARLCKRQVREVEHGYKELLIPAGKGGTWKIDRHALHIWPRKHFMLMALANLDGTFTCTLFLPVKGEVSFSALRGKSKVLPFFRRVFPDALPLMPELDSEFFSHPTSRLAVVKCDPWHHAGKVMLIGDAAHAILPFFGEGMNCGFEDCLLLDTLIGAHGDEWKKILPAYHAERKPNGDAIAELSERNLLEMRHLVADPQWLLRKKIEMRLHERHPDRWLPLYSKVKFSNIPYTEALREGQRQDKIMEAVLALPDINSKWKSREVEKFVLKILRSTRSPLSDAMSS